MKLDFLWELIFPSSCLNCKKPLQGKEVVCDSCLEEIPLHQTFFCGECRARLPDNKKICHLNFPYLLAAASDYENAALKNLIQALKFQFIKSAADSLGKLIIRYAEAIRFEGSDFLVIPVPLARERERKRGFNQAELISKTFADHFKLPLAAASLIRPKNSPPQSEIKDFEKRRLNVKNCFSVQNGEELKGKHIILIDDVTTSGATLYEAASILKAYGAKKIIAFTAAKT
ncbi:MAG: ComF family protein [Candidatus Liptonbacteria bacterium]|nr:ComF family protein [Candidatus Liptonbacteria bacterium]